EPLVSRNGRAGAAARAPLCARPRQRKLPALTADRVAARGLVEGERTSSSDLSRVARVAGVSRGSVAVMRRPRPPYLTATPLGCCPVGNGARRSPAEPAGT